MDLLPKVSLEDPMKVDFPHYFSFLGVTRKMLHGHHRHHRHHYQLDDLDQLPQLQIHCSSDIRIKLDPKLPVFILRPSLLLEIPGLDCLRFMPLHMRSVFAAVIQSKYIFIFLHRNIGGGGRGRGRRLHSNGFAFVDFICSFA